MTAAMEMPRVQECVVAACAYNHTGDCHAFAITIGSMDHAHCHTFIELPVARPAWTSLIARSVPASGRTAGTTSSWSATRRPSRSARTTTWPTA